MLAALIRASVRFRYLLVAVAAGLMIVGIARLPRTPVDVLPETSPVVVQLQTEAQGLSAAEVESLVTVPLEKTLLEGVMGVVNVTSDSIPGLSSIVLHFAPGTNLYQARQLVQERLSGAFVLPAVSKPPVMLQPLSTTSDVMLVGLSSSTLSQIDLSVLSRWTIVPRLLGVAGVANVSTFGQADRQLQVLVQPTTMAARHISLAQVIAAAGNSQLVSPLSYLQGSTPGTGGFLENQNQRLTIRHILPFGTPGNLGQVPVAGHGPNEILLSQVASVVAGHQPLIGEGLVSGKPGLVLVIQKLPGASVPAVTAGIDQALVQLKPAMTGVNVDTRLFRPASYVASAESNVRLALIIAGILAVLAFGGLLLSSRLAFTALAAMAVSLVAAALVLQAFGYSFNSLVLLGLVLALAVVVDDAARSTTMVMSRLADQQPEAGLSAPDRVISAVRELAGPLAATSIAALLAGVPVFLATGVTASFLHPMIVAYGVAIGVSLIIAVTFTPALAAVVMSWSGRAPRGAIFARQAATRYTAVLRRIMQLPSWSIAAVGVAGVIVLAVAVPNLHPARPAFQDRNLAINWTGAPGMALPELQRVSALASRELLAVPGVQDVAATLGRAVSSDQIVNTDTGKLWVTIRPDADYAQTVAGVENVVNETPGMSATVSTAEDDAMAGVLAGSPQTETVRVYGPDLGVLNRLASRVQSVMSHVPGLTQAHVITPVQQPTINVEVNVNKARAVGLAPGDARREAATLLYGLTVGNFFQEQKVFDVVVVAQPSDRASIEDIQNMLIDNGYGGQVRLGDIARVSVSPEPTDIQHQAMSPYLDVRADLTGSASATSAQVDSGLRHVSFPLEYHAQIIDTGTSGSSTGSLVTYAVAALVGIILVSQAVLGSWRLAAISVAAVVLPIAAAAIVALALGSAASLGATAGILAVLALGLRQAIGVTTRIRRRHATEGGGLTPALVAAGAAENAWPVLTSALVTALVLAPFIFLGTVPGNELVQPAAIVIFFGLLVATAVNLLLLPMAYLLAGPKAPVPAEETRAEQAGPTTLQPGPSPGAAISERTARPMHLPKPRWAAVVAFLVLAIAGLTACGTGSPTDAPQVPPARMVHVGHSKALSVALTPLGAERIGVETAPAVAQGTFVVIPYAALLYEPDGQTAVYTKTTAFDYTRQFVTVSSINGSSVLLSGGLQPGTQVVTQGGEELLGVQNGVGVET